MLLSAPAQDWRSRSARRARASSDAGPPEPSTSARTPSSAGAAPASEVGDRTELKSCRHAIRDRRLASGPQTYAAIGEASAAAHMIDRRSPAAARRIVVPPPGPRARRDTGAAGASSRSKRDEILRTATQYFGENGYEATKLADVAAAVGIGSTALYHYFESKLHCLYVIMADALGIFRSDFDRLTGEHEDYMDALLAVLRGSYDLSDQDVLRNRVLVAEQGLVGVRRTSPREEEARDARSSPDPRCRVHLGDVPRARHGAGTATGERPPPAHSRAARLVQQHLALVPPARLRSASKRSRSSSSAGSWKCSVFRPSSPTVIGQLGRERSAGKAGSACTRQPGTRRRVRRDTRRRGASGRPAGATGCARRARGPGQRLPPHALEIAQVSEVVLPLRGACVFLR